MSEPVPQFQTFGCPRCSCPTTEAWYGPCPSCRAELRATFAGEQRQVATSDYVPKVNVTPNAVATKD
ncbi:MAG: hypothetical protein ACR2MB_09740 [Acidimicrobiales bacterium]